MKKLIKTVLVVVFALEILLIGEIITIKNERAKQTHNIVVEKTKDFFVKAAKRVEEFFSREKETTEQIDSRIPYKDDTPKNSRVPQLMKASQRYLKGGDK